MNTEYVTGNKALYRVHCLTFGIAKEICGIPHDSNLATSVNFELRRREIYMHDKSGLATFRAHPQYRTPKAKELRAKVHQVMISALTGLNAYAIVRSL